MMTQKEKILTAALFRCARALVRELERNLDGPKGSSAAHAVAAMNASLLAAKADTDHLLAELAAGNRLYLASGGKDLFELEGRK